MKSGYRWYIILAKAVLIEIQTLATFFVQNMGDVGYVNPYNYLSLDGNNRRYLEDYGVSTKNYQKMKYADYIDLLEQVKDKMEKKEIAEQSFPEFSANAYSGDGMSDDDGTDESYYQEIAELLRFKKNIIVDFFLLLMLAVICSAFGFAMQPVAQRTISSETAGVLTALNPLTTAILGTIVLTEPFGINSIAGAALILTGVILHNLFRKSTRDLF